MQIETDREFWTRQLEEWRKLVRQRKLKELNSQNNSPVNHDATNKPV